MKLPASLASPMYAHHEQSETVKTDAGWQNVYGRRTPHAGRPLPIKHEYEQDAYADVTNALLAAIMRSLFEGMAQQFTGGNLPGRR